jgi:DNA-binding XRE family transcriptional regulator
MITKGKNMVKFNGEKLRKIREKANHTPKTVTFEMNKKGLEITEMTYRNYENGVYVPNADTLIMLARVLDTNLEKMFS